jgi:hypothetical protein
LPECNRQDSSGRYARSEQRHERTSQQAGRHPGPCPDRAPGPERGLQKATEDGLDERLIRILEDFYAKPSGRLGIQFSGWSFLSLPHKALPPEQKWERTLHTDGLTCSLIVEPGELIIDGKPQSFGVPFGPTARLILLFLQTQALEQQSREIEVGNTTYAWLRRLGLSVGGQDYRRFREPMMRLMTCSVRFLYENRQENGARSPASPRTR